MCIVNKEVHHSCYCPPKPLWQQCLSRHIVAGVYDTASFDLCIFVMYSENRQEADWLCVKKKKTVSKSKRWIFFNHFIIHAQNWKHPVVRVCQVANLHCMINKRANKPQIGNLHPSILWGLNNNGKCISILQNGKSHPVAMDTSCTHILYIYGVIVTKGESPSSHIF